MYYFAFGETLRKLRKGRGMTQSELGEKIGASKAVVSKFETGTGTPTYDVLIRIARLFGVTTDYLLGLESPEVLPAAGLTPEQIELLRHLVAEFQKANEK